MSEATQQDVDKQFNEIVRVSEFGGSEQSLAFSSETTVAQYLARAGVETPLPKGQSVSVNGQIVKDLSAPVEPNSVLVVTSNISNG